MAANGLTKPHISANFEVFVWMTGIEDEKDLLTLIKREEELREILEQQKTGPEYSMAFGYRVDINQDVGMWLLKQGLGIRLATLLPPITELKWEHYQVYLHSNLQISTKMENRL